MHPSPSDINANSKDKVELKKNDKQESGEKNVCDPKNLILVIIKCILYGIITLLFLVKIGTLTAVTSNQVDFISFPNDCSAWAKEQGCTRVVLEKEQCVRPKDIATKFSTTFLN